MKNLVTKIVRFELAHKLTSAYTKGCKRVHGHGYKLEVTFVGDLNEDGMIMDFKMMKEILQPIVDEFDHTYIDEQICGYKPTAENMCNYIFRKISNSTRQIYRVRLWETDTCYAEVKY